MTRRAALLLLASTGFAPAPLPRRVDASQITPGAYVLYWLGTPWDATLSPCGAWTARSGSAVFVGSWRWDARGRVLTIRERPAWYDGGHMTYRVELDRSLCGPERGGEGVRLERRR